MSRLKASHLVRLRCKPTLPASLKWRAELMQRRAAAQLSALLLQRKDPIPLLLRSKPALLPSHPSTSLLLQVLHRTQSQPETALRFFNRAKSDLNLIPDLKSHCKMAQILVQSDHLDHAHQLFDPILRSEPASAIIDSLLEIRLSSKESQSQILNFLLESYCSLDRVADALNVFRRIRICGCMPSTQSCNVLLGALCSSNHIGIAWCSYAAVLRAGAVPDARTWALLARLLCGQGKLEGAAELLNLGYCRNTTYDLLIDCYSKRGDFRSAIGLLNAMCDKGLRPRFGAYSSILDGSCKFGDIGVIHSMLKGMVVGELLPTVPFLDYNRIIRRLCEVEKTYTAEMFFERARNESFRLDKGSYVCMLRALAKEGRVEYAMKVYHIMLQEGVEVNPGCYDVFLSAVCKGEPSHDADLVLKDVIERGFEPRVSDLSQYIASQCSKGQWNEANDLLNVALENGILLDASCCRSLIERLCANGLLDSAIMLHHKMKKLGGCLDVASYNALIEALVKKRRLEEAIQVFEYMRERNVVSSASFVIMVGALCHRKELRKAMKLHDEMLKVGLKPDDVTYKHLISGFA